MRELMAVSIDDIQFDDVQAFCSHQTRENMRLDYKRGWSTNEPAKKIAKEVAAFANSQGGTILYGVEGDVQKKGIPNKSPGGCDLGPNPEQTIQSACAHNIFPPIVPQVSRFIRNPQDQSRGFVIVRVAASEDVHTVDGRTGIYIRVNDQSEPVAAPIETIEWLLQRRERAVKVQEARRNGMLVVLRNLQKSQGRAGVVDVLIGPKITTAPFINLSTLHDFASRISIRSHCCNSTAPIDARFSVGSMQDAIYCNTATGTGDEASAIDIYGNVALTAPLLHPYTPQPEEAFARDLVPNAKLHGVEAPRALERLLTAMLIANAYYAAVAFVGLCQIGFSVPLANELPLVAFGGRRLPTILGVCAPGAKICVEATVSTVELAQAAGTVLEGMVSRILWAWGCTDPKQTVKMTERAENYHYGK